MRPIRDTVICVDTENGYIRLREQHGHALDAGEVIERAGGWARVLEIRAYGDFTQLPQSLRRHLRQHAVLPIHVPCRTASGQVIKDAVDDEIRADLLEIAYVRRDVRRVVIVAGDGGYVRALTHVRQQGKEVVVLAVQGSVSLDLQEFAGDAIAFLNGHALPAAVHRHAA